MSEAAPERDDDVPAVANEFRTLWLRLLQYAVLFVNTILVARALGPAPRAQYALAFALSGAIWVFLNLSVEAAAGRMVGRGDVSFEDVTGALFFCAIIMAGVGLGLTVTVGWLAREALVGNSSLAVIVVSGLSIPGLLATQFAGYLLLMRGHIRAYAWAVLIAAVGQLTLVLALLLTGDLDILSASVTTSAGFALSGAILVAVLGRAVGFAKLVPAYNAGLLSKLVRIAGTIHPMSIAIQLGPRLELIVVGALASARATGLYSIALTVAQVPLFAAWTMAQTGIGPITNKSEDDAVAYGCEFTRQAALVGLALAAAGDLIAYPFIRFGYGRAWIGAVLPLIVLLTGTVAWAIENPLRILLLRIARPSQMAIIALLSVVLNALLTVALTPGLGITGAAIASFTAYWALAAGMLRLLKGAAPTVRLKRYLRRPGPQDWVLERVGQTVTQALSTIGRKTCRRTAGARSGQ